MCSLNYLHKQFGGHVYAMLNLNEIMEADFVATQGMAELSETLELMDLRKYFWISKKDI